VIRVERVAEPSEFDRKCRVPGNRWIAANPGRRPNALWAAFTAALADGFQQRCGYSAVLIQNGTVDHFLSWKNRPELTYEWSNYRYADHRLNAKKQNIDDAILDPYEVGDDWFEILLPSLQMRVTDRVPAKLRKRAELTLRRLGLVTTSASWPIAPHGGACSLRAPSGEHARGGAAARARDRARRRHAGSEAVFDDAASPAAWRQPIAGQHHTPALTECRGADDLAEAKVSEEHMNSTMRVECGSRP
jgi:hypothetical protein